MIKDLTRMEGLAFEIFFGCATNQGPSRAWRAPNHPQAALITMAALEDTAAKLSMDPVEFFRKNIDMTGPRAKTYERSALPAPAPS